ncbi:acyltransferase [Actinoplanes sp. NBRC 101535]|uniref:acyltransferase family protein n=1 Tax=Actinoplanes sp. NBRC 101535 TaxID=3032196 RepID=UPI0024A23302|nr:acyltransferase [Actinoplanes sp. NBRC 101535]GLY00141.1 hypothetical protein Acsp01_05200 [Actinoplanes sp. NBRC 101535]
MHGTRLAWLDALRGYAAVVVAAFHLSPVVLGADRHLALYRAFDAGKYAVLLFFLVSGYVIPMSLERHGSLRRFWTGRIARIYPAYLLTILLALALAAAGLYRLPEQWRGETSASVLAHASMLQDLLGVRGLVRPFWTLSFEMLFYLVVAGLFAWRLHRLSAWWATGLTAVAVLGGPYLPDGLLGATARDRLAVAGLALLLLGGCFLAYTRGSRIVIVMAGGVGLGMATPAFVNGHATKWVTSASSGQALLFLAVMFAGTVVYRVQHGQIGRGNLVALVVVFGAWTGEKGWEVPLAVLVTFGGAFVLRHRRVPAVLTWLGTVSYSLYLLHILVLGLVVRLTDSRPLIIVGFVTGTLAVAWASHRFVEEPGRRLARSRMDTEGGTPRTPSFGKQRESV